MSGMKRTAISGYCSDPNDRSNEPIDVVGLNRIQGKRVVRAEKWTCPLENWWAALYCIGIGHQGVVVTLQDGTRYIVHKLPSVKKEGDGDVVVAKASGMGSNWSQFDQKVIRNAKVGDFLQVCGFKYNGISDNCMHAVWRMWELD